MKILVTGSRTWTDWNTIERAIFKARKHGSGELIIIHGGARGADTIAGEIAKRYGFEVKVYPVTDAEWKQYGWKAGHLRNEKMLLDSKPDIVLAFLDPNSKTGGTKNMIETAKKHGYRGIIYKEKK